MTDSRGNIKNHYQELFISDINEDILRCRILGKVIEKKEGSFILDDGTGIIEVILNEDISKIKTSLDIGKDVLVFGKVINIDNEYKIFADIVRDIGSMEPKLYRRVMRIWKEKNKTS